MQDIEGIAAPLAFTKHGTEISMKLLVWQARRASNPQPSVLETDALPIELLAFIPRPKRKTLMSAEFSSSLTHRGQCPTAVNLRLALDRLLNNLCHHAGADGPATFANGKTQPLFHRNGRDQRHRHLNVVPRHHHLGALRQLDAPVTSVVENKTAADTR